MATEQEMAVSVASVVEGVLQQHGPELSDRSLASRKAEEASSRRYEAGGWLRKTVGVVGGKDLPAEPSEEEFRLALRSGIILCNALNKVQPGAIPKVVEGPSDSVIIPDGAALSVFQYFENVRNFLVVVEEMGIPTFEASDLEQGGKSARVVNCVLALKAYSDWKQGGGVGSWKFSGTKPTACNKHFIRKNSEPFMNSFSRTYSASEKSQDVWPADFDFHADLCHDFNAAGLSHSLSTLVCQVLSDKKPEDIPMVVESLLSKVMEEFKSRLAHQNELMKTELQEREISDSDKSPSISASREIKTDEQSAEQIQSKRQSNQTFIHDEGLNSEIVEQQLLVEQQQKDIQTEEQSAEQIQSKGQSDQTCVLDEGLNCEIVKQQDLVKQQQKDFQTEERSAEEIQSEGQSNQTNVDDEQLKAQIVKQQQLVKQQQEDIQELKHTASTAKEGMQFLQLKYMEEIANLGKQLHGLAHAANAYRKVLEENRRLYNQVQDLKGNIRVYCRVRPFLSGQPNRASVVDRIEEGNITINTPLKNGKEARKLFTFNKVFGPSATQEEVFSDTQPLVRSVLDGYNVCIFAYGQTGSGKTFTMTGPKVFTEEGMGVNYRALNDLFILSEQRKDSMSYEVSVQMIEIYNEQVRDLLVTDSGHKKVEIRNSSQNGINVPDANLVRVSSPSDIMSLMNLGHKNRTVSATALNDRSSRSHSCLTVHVQGKEITSGSILRGSMHLVDLAGSERVEKSKVLGDGLKEAQHINKSLAALGDVIASLAQKNSHVPYRNSKLTQLLQDSLGGQAKTLMFVHISPEADALVETISTLKFAERVSTVELGTARANKDKDTSDVKELKEQIASLKAALARKGGEAEDSRSSSPERTEIRPGVASSISSESSVDGSMSHGQPMENGGNIEGQSKPMMKPNRRSFDFHDLAANSPPWPPVASTGLSGKDDDKESVSGEWVDKVMVKKHDNVAREENHPVTWEAENDSDDLDAATSDSSEPDLLWQISASKVSKKGAASKLKKPQPKPAKGPEIRSLIPSPNISPLPTKKIPNGVSHKTRLPTFDGRRRNGTAK